MENQGVGSTLDLPVVTPPNSPTLSGAGNPTHGNTDINIPTIISHDSTTTASPPLSTLIPDTLAVGVSAYNSTLVENRNSTLVQLVAHNSTTESSLRHSTYACTLYQSLVMLVYTGVYLSRLWYNIHDLSETIDDITMTSWILNFSLCNKV